MKDYLTIAAMAVVVMLLVVLMGRKFNLSSRYERKPRVLNPWNALDKGIDPTEDQHQ
ncbi:hypothetical protein MCEMZLE14_00581 [Candidatus Nanopelagicaceae bacterium]